MYNFDCNALEEISEPFKIDKKQNVILIEKANGRLFKTNCFTKEIHSGLTIRITGENNLIILKEPIYFKNSIINISSSNNIVEINPTKRLVILNLCITDGNHQTLFIGKEFSCGNTRILMHEEYVPIKIGNDCMFSAEILLMNSDCHCVSNLNSENICSNFAKGINIGNHVWIGRGASIFKNGSIPNGSILGAYSVLTRKFVEENIAIAGNPAKIVKSNITWDRKSVSKFIRENSCQEFEERYIKNKIDYNNFKKDIFNPYQII